MAEFAYLGNITDGWKLSYKHVAQIMLKAQAAFRLLDQKWGWRAHNEATKETYLTV